MTRLWYFLSGIFFVSCKTFFACLYAILEVPSHLCYLAICRCEIGRLRAIDRLQKPIRQNTRRIL